MMRRRPSALFLALGCAVAILFARPASAQTSVDLALVLAVDASGSVNQYRFDLQKKGYVAAFRNPQVLRAIMSAGANGTIAVTMVQWTGPALQVHAVPWMTIKDQASVEAVASAIDKAPRELFGGGTSISGAIDYGLSLLQVMPFKATRRVVDISGDGSNNRGRSVREARDEAVAAGVVINGLPIVALEPGLERYFYDNVIGGPGAFVVAAQSYETFGDAILKKLITEIAGDGFPPCRGHAADVSPITSTAARCASLAAGMPQ
jgi:hypothetical protein